MKHRYAKNKSEVTVKTYCLQVYIKQHNSFYLTSSTNTKNIYFTLKCAKNHIWGRFSLKKINSETKLNVANPIPMPRIRKALVKSDNWMGTRREIRGLLSAKHWSAFGMVGWLFTQKRMRPLSHKSMSLLIENT